MKEAVESHLDILFLLFCFQVFEVLVQAAEVALNKAVDPLMINVISCFLLSGDIVRLGAGTGTRAIKGMDRVLVTYFLWNNF